MQAAAAAHSARPYAQGVLWPGRRRAEDGCSPGHHRHVEGVAGVVPLPKQLSRDVRRSVKSYRG